jgi:hypothetical protein
VAFSHCAASAIYHAGIAQWRCQRDLPDRPNFGTDWPVAIWRNALPIFGPLPSATEAQARQAQKKWQDWLNLQIAMSRPYSYSHE